MTPSFLRGFVHAIPMEATHRRSAMNTALIIGASRGLGLGLAEEYLKRCWCVIATVRGNVRTGLNDLADSHGDHLEIEQLDINRPDQLAALRAKLDGRRLDLL